MEFLHKFFQHFVLNIFRWYLWKFFQSYHYKILFSEISNEIPPEILAQFFSRNISSVNLRFLDTSKNPPSFFQKFLCILLKIFLQGCSMDSLKISSRDYFIKPFWKSLKKFPEKSRIFIYKNLLWFTSKNPPRYRQKFLKSSLQKHVNCFLQKISQRFI